MTVGFSIAADTSTRPGLARKIASHSGRDDCSFQLGQSLKRGLLGGYSSATM